MYKPIEYYTELIQKFEEWIKYLKNGGNPNLVERLLEREGIYSADYIDYKLAYNPVIMGLSVTTDEDTEITFRRKTIDKYCELIDTIKEYKEEAQREQERKKIQEEAQEKHIELIKPYLKKLIQSEKYKHWCTFDNDKYIWYSERGSKRDLVLFLEAVYQILNRAFQNYKYLEKYFGVRGLRQYKNTCIEKDYWSPKIKEIKEYLLKEI
jgi:hypothetical protein